MASTSSQADRSGHRSGETYPKNMKICILGEVSDQLDEGMKNTSIQLTDRLHEAGHEVRLFDLRTISNPRFWWRLVRFDPEIVHLVPGPTLKGLGLLELLSKTLNCRTVATATQPRFSDRSWKLSQAVRPDRLLVQSESDQTRFSEAGYHTESLPSGVDLDRFQPVDSDTQDSIRAELGLDPDERVFLHVGHFKEGRNLRSLLSLQEYGTVVVVGSPSTGPQQTLIADLEDAGCVVQTAYVERIERYYQAADWYVFPVIDETNSIRAPLSVLEAMGCNLPVLATRFGALPDMFDSGDGLVYISDVTAVDETTLDTGPVRTRENVDAYSWGTIVDQVQTLYGEL